MNGPDCLSKIVALHPTEISRPIDGVQSLKGFL